MLSAQRLTMQTFMERFLTPFVDSNFYCQWYGTTPAGTPKIYYDRFLLWELTYIEHRVEQGIIFMHFTNRFSKVVSSKKVLYQDVLLQKKMFPRRIQRINLP